MRNLHQIAAEYKCEKCQISKIIRDKARIMAKLNQGLNPTYKCLIPHCMPYEESEKRLFDYFSRARNLGYIISGLRLITEANQYALEMGLIKFQASTGWLDSFKKCHNIKFPTLCRESNDVPTATVEEYQRSAKDTVSKTSSMLMRVASSTDSFSAGPLYRPVGNWLKTHARVERGKSLKTTSLSYLPVL